MRPVLVILAGFALVTLLLGWTRWLSDRRWAAAGNFALCFAATGLTVWLWPVGLHLETYQPHRPGQAIADLFLEQTGSNQFRASLTRFPSGRMQVFELAGTQWRVEARTLAWIDRAAKFGMPPSHRLERLSSRAAGATDGVDLIQSNFALAEDQGADLWTEVRQGPIWNRALEAGLAASAWQPMTNGARFELRIGPDGLEANPLNAAASASLAVPAEPDSGTDVSSGAASATLGSQS